VAVRRFAPLAAVSIASLLCAACGARSTSEPAWVVTGVKTLRAYFLGTPRPEMVTWGRDSKHRWVTVVFRAAQTCAPCHGDPVGDTGVVVGRRATLTWAATGPSFYSVRIQKQ